MILRKALKETLGSLFVLVAIPALASPDRSVAPPPQGLAATELCSYLGGTHRLLRDQFEPFSTCYFGSAGVDVATLFRVKMLNDEADSVSLFFEHRNIVLPPVDGIAMYNPASVYCEKLGGMLKSLRDESDNELAFCQFSDGSSIEEWTLFRGPDVESSAGLLDALR